MIEQGSPEWFAARLGKCTASRIADVVAKTKTGWGASRKNYAAQLVAERLTGEPMQTYSNAAMQYGIECEPEARAAYSFQCDVDVIECSFFEHPLIKMAGASPDGLVGTAGLVEIKCPNTATHIETLLSKTVDGDYVKQMQFQMACTGRQWVDFVSYDRRLPESMRLFIKRIHRDDAMIEELDAAVREFLREIEMTERQLRELYPMQAAA